MMPASPGAEVVRSSGSLYDTIVEHNYMAHREIQERVAPVLAARAGRGSCTLLDLDRNLAMVRTGWTVIGREGFEEVARHIRAHDFPETQSALTEMARAAGLGESALLGRFGPHQILRFTRSAPWKPGTRDRTPVPIQGARSTPGQDGH